MKTKLLLLLLLLPIISLGQDAIQPNHLLSAGNYMLVGTAITVVGVSTAAYGYSLNEKEGKLFTIAGLGISGIGTIIYIMGIDHIRIAGKNLDLTFNEGIGLSLRI